MGSFDQLDLDGDGELTRDEIRAGLAHKLGHPPSETMVDNVIRSIDLDGSGTINRDEFEHRDEVPSVGRSPGI